MIGSATPAAVAVAAVVGDLAGLEGPAAGRARVCAGSAVGAAGVVGCPAGASPLRVDDPVRVGGYRLVARLGAGGMADVFYAVASTGRPVVVKVFRVPDGGVAACHREYQLARAAGVGCTVPVLGYGTSAAVSYLVMGYVPGYRCAAMLRGRRVPAVWWWRFGAGLARVLAGLRGEWCIVM